MKIVQSLIDRLKFCSYVYDIAECMKSDQMFRDEMEGKKIWNTHIEGLLCKLYLIPSLNR